jgi:galactonate dehydratase
LAIPIAPGERSYTCSGFRNLLDTGGVDIVMPDVGYCGDTAMGPQVRAGLPNNYVDGI